MRELVGYDSQIAIFLGSRVQNIISGTIGTLEKELLALQGERGGSKQCSPSRLTVRRC